MTCTDHRPSPYRVRMKGGCRSHCAACGAPIVRKGVEWVDEEERSS